MTTPPRSAPGWRRAATWTPRPPSWAGRLLRQPGWVGGAGLDRARAPSRLGHHSRLPVRPLPARRSCATSGRWRGRGVPDAATSPSRCGSPSVATGHARHFAEVAGTTGVGRATSGRWRGRRVRDAATSPSGCGSPSVANRHAGHFPEVVRLTGAGMQPPRGGGGVDEGGTRHLGEVAGSTGVGCSHLGEVESIIQFGVRHRPGQARRVGARRSPSRADPVPGHRGANRVPGHPRTNATPVTVGSAIPHGWARIPPAIP